MPQTLSQKRLNTVKAVYPPTDFTANPKWVIEESSQERTITRYQSNSASNSSITWNPSIADTRTILDRQVLIKVPVRLTVNHGGADGAFQNAWGVGDSFRFLPIHNCFINTMQVQMNNTTYSMPFSDIIEPMFRFQPEEEKNRMLSMTTSMQDQSQAYSDVFGGVRSPLLNYANGVPGANQNPRGGFPVTFVSDVGGVAIIDAVFAEWVLLSPFLFSKREEPGIYGLNQFILTLNMDPNLSRCLSADLVNGAPIAGAVTVDITTNSLLANPELQLTTYTPKYNMPLPDEFSWSLFNVQRYSQAVGTINAGATQQVVTPSIQVNGVPKMIYLFCRQSNNTRTFANTDSYHNISNISVSFANRSGLLSSADEYSLYNIAQANGCNLSWEQWHSEVGSVVALNMSHDIGLPDDLAPGSEGTYQLQIQATINSLSAANLDSTLYMVVVQEGILSYKNGSYFQDINVVNSEIVLQTKSELPGVAYDDYIAHNSFYGGRSFSKRIGDLKKFAKKAIKTGRKVASSKLGQAALGALDTAVGFVPEGRAVADAIKKYGPAAVELAEELLGSGVIGGCSFDEACMMASGVVGGKRGPKPKKRLR